MGDQHTPTTRQRLIGCCNAAPDQNEHVTNIIKTNESSSFFECNICLDLAREPVVTCCGHLFCWPCLYQWLCVHSTRLKQCPICKGEVEIKTITPIYTRGKQTSAAYSTSSIGIPSRPQANRVESWSESFERNILDSNSSMFETIRRERDTPLLNRIFTTRGIRRERETTDDDGLDSLLISSVNPVLGGSNGADNIPNLTSAETFIESYLRNHPNETNQEDLPLIDRHSMSSIAGIIHSESQTAEIDSMVSGSSRRRRRCESSTSRVSDVNSVESQASQSTRRRLQ